MSPTCVSVLVGLTMAVAPLGEAFVAPGSGFQVLHVKNTAATSSWRAPKTASRPSRRMSAEGATEEETTDGDEKKKTKPPAWMFNEKGVAYAPWMVDQFDPENLAKVAASIEARKKKEADMVPEAYGSLARDPQQMELSGAGLKAKRIADDIVELTWTTGEEKGNLGFIVNRRKGKTEKWEEIASYTNFPPLNSKGPSGGTYTIVDEGVEEGTWVYRVSDISKSGVRNDVCQTLIELQTSSEALQTKIGLGFLAVALLVAAAAGTMIDPFAS
ncbi:unnamed protein product [Ascophyllum nodosum]